MIRALALALLLPAALPPQEDFSRKIEEILPRLSDDSIDVRDRAVQALADLGPSAVPLMRKFAAGLGAESRGRLLEACARIDSQNTLAKFLPPLKKLTLEWENKPAREAFEEIARRSGLAVDSSGAGADAAVSFSLKEASPVEALDEVCRRAGLTWRIFDNDLFAGRRRGGVAGAGTRILIQNGKTAEYPTAYLRHYRMRVTQVSMTRTNNFLASQANAHLNLELGYAPDVKPDGLLAFKVTELRDEQGRSLLPEENNRLGGRSRSVRGGSRGRDVGAYSQYLAFQFPEADAKKIALLKGSAVFTYPQELKTLAFDKPLQAQGKSLDLNGLTITLKECQEKGTGFSITLEMSGKLQGPRDGDAGGEDDFGNLPFSTEDVELLTEAGESLRHQGMSSRGDGKTSTWQLDFEGEKASAAKELRISCVLRRYHDEAAFEIRDIALPK